MGELVSLVEARRRLRPTGAPACDGWCSGCRAQLGPRWFVVGSLPGVFCSLECAEAMLDERC